MAPFTATLRIILPVTLMLLLGILRREKWIAKEEMRYANI